MNIPEEFKDYLLSNNNLSTIDQNGKFIDMHLKEVEERCRLLRNLKYDKRETKKRIKQNVRWEFESTTLPSFYNQIDKIVDSIYETKAPKER